MIILIGGMGYTGKTLLAQKLLEKHGIAYLSLDHLKMGLYRGLKEERYSPIQDYRILGETLWPIVKGIIMTNVENRQNIIIEGCYILPQLSNDFEDEYLKEIVTIFLGYSPDYIRSNYDEIIIKHANVIEDRGELCAETMESYLQLTDELKSACIKNNCKYFEIEEKYETEIKKITGYINDWINKMMP